MRNKVIGKKWIYSERNSVHRVWAIAEGEWAPNCGWVNEWQDYSNFFGERAEISRN